jgi:uncharacterized membrane protein YhaH (DUF805 family)
MGLLHYLFGFSGRINRAKVFFIYLIPIAMVAVLGAAVSILTMNGVTVAEADRPDNWRHWVMLSILVALGLAWLWAHIAIYVKRLHDRDKSAWWLLVYYGPTLLLFALVAASPRAVDIHSVAPLLVTLVFPSILFLLWAFIELHFLRGSEGENRFGPDPLAS